MYINEPASLVAIPAEHAKHTTLSFLSKNRSHLPYSPANQQDEKMTTCGDSLLILVSQGISQVS